MEQLFMAGRLYTDLNLVYDAMDDPGLDYDNSIVKQEFCSFLEKCLRENSETHFNNVVCDKRVDINYKQELNGYSILHITCCYGKVWALKCLLNQNRLNINLDATRTGETGLLIAVKHNNIDMVNLFVRDPRTDVDANYSYGVNTALEQAIVSQHWDLVELLLLRQPKVNSFQCKRYPLLCRYDHDPVTVMRELRLKHGITVTGDMSVIKDASYVVYDKTDYPYYDKVSCNSKWAQFYTFDGKPLIKVQHQLLDMSQRLDPLSPKPQIVKLQNQQVTFTPKNLYDVSYIFFVDNNDIIIGSDRYYNVGVPHITSTDLEPYKSKYDLSLVPLYVWNVKGTKPDTKTQPVITTTANVTDEQLLSSSSLSTDKGTIVYDEESDYSTYHGVCTIL